MIQMKMIMNKKQLEKFVYDNPSGKVKYDIKISESEIRDIFDRVNNKIKLEQRRKKIEKIRSRIC